MKKEYIAATAILVKKRFGETISDAEEEIVNTLLNNDHEFKALIDKIETNDYLSLLSDYHETNAEENIKIKIQKRITEIKRKRNANRRRKLTVVSAAAAMIAIIITISLQFIDIKPNLSLFTNVVEPATNRCEDVILITEKGENIKLTGTIYNAAKKENNIPNDTIIESAIPQNTMATIVVPMTKDFNIVLSDGTKVWLNSGSKLTFPNEFQKNERIVEIDGEGYFEVAPNEEKPFIVRNLVMDTKVLGTKFLVSAYSSDLSQSIALVEGSVEVSSLISDFKSKLIPGRGVVFNAEKHNFTNVEVNVENILSKVSGMLVFENESLETICNALMRKYGISYSINNDKLKKKQFYIRTKKYDSIETVMELLKMAGDINYKIENNNLTLY